MSSDMLKLSLLSPAVSIV